MRSTEPVLKAACEECRSESKVLYCTACGHTTLCASCGRSMARSRGRCLLCAAPITALIREYNVQFNVSTDKTFYIGRFVTGLPPISKKGADIRWSLHKDDLQERQLTDNMQAKYNKKPPWVLEDETGQHQYLGQIEGSQSAIATYYLLMLHGEELHAFRAGSWYNFSKIARYKQLTLEEAEEKMNKKGTIATRYQRWMMKRATNRLATFGLNMKNVYAANGEATDRVRAKKGNSNEDGNHSDKCEDDDEAAQKKRLGLTKMSMDDDNGGGKDPNSDLGDEIEKDDDSEHEEIFTGDDEAVDIDTKQIAALAEFPVPPEIKQDDDENEEGDLSKSGKELQKLLKCAYVPNELDAYEEDGSTPVCSPKQKDQPKNKPVDNSPAKPTLSSVHAHGTPPASKSRGKKRSWGGDAKTSNGTAPRGLNVESAAQTSGGKDDASSSKPTLKSSVTAQDDTNVCPVTEKEIRSIILTEVPIAKEDLYADLSLEGKVALKGS